MSIHAAQLDLDAVFRPPTMCPACGAVGLAPTGDGVRANFLCAQCGSCWHSELGWLSLVDPRDCAQCEHREACLVARAGEEDVVRTRFGEGGACESD